jgi:hypothetical protein
MSGLHCKYLIIKFLVKSCARKESLEFMSKYTIFHSGYTGRNTLFSNKKILLLSKTDVHK